MNAILLRSSCSTAVPVLPRTGTVHVPVAYLYSNMVYWNSVLFAQQVSICCEVHFDHFSSPSRVTSPLFTIPSSKLRRNDGGETMARHARRFRMVLRLGSWRRVSLTSGTVYGTPKRRAVTISGEYRVGFYFRFPQGFERAL